MKERGTVLVACLLVLLKLSAGVAVYVSCAIDAGEQEAREERERDEKLRRSGGGSCAACTRPSTECVCGTPDHH